jgi:hypothetical protein
MIIPRSLRSNYPCDRQDPNRRRKGNALLRRERRSGYLVKTSAAAQRSISSIAPLCTERGPRLTAIAPWGFRTAPRFAYPSARGR